MSIYLDNNATTQIAPEVVDAMIPWLREGYGNPSSVYSSGRAAAAALELAHSQVASLAGCRESELIFTSCGTESINTAILSALALDPDNRHIITSTVEHSATIKLCEHLAQRGYEITWLPVDSLGRLDPEQLASSIRSDTALVTLLWANNETGVLFPIKEIAEIVRKKKTLLHLDAVQAFGKLPTNVEELGCHFLSLSGHKLHAPKGVGALYVSRRVKFTPLFRGSQENSRRGGTQNVASIVGFGVGAQMAAEHLGDTFVQSARDRFESHLLANVPDCVVNGDREDRLPNTTNVSFTGVDSEGLLLMLDQRGLCCSAGSACTSGSVNPSHVLKAMGFSNDHARASLRFSFGRFNSEEDVAKACNLVPQAIAKLRAMSPTGSPVLVAR